MSVEFESGRTRRVAKSTGWLQVIELPAVKVEALEGPHRGQDWLIALPTIRIGSAPDCDVPLEDDTVSRQHARISRTTQGLLLKDLGSTNGTSVRGVRCVECYLEADAQITIGKSVLKVGPATEEYSAVERARTGLGLLMGESPAMQEIYSLIQAIAPSPATVLVEGETGTGKELVARTLHELSGRRGNLVTFDCAATSEEFIRSELFGHQKGAFTGAESAREGAFRAARSGTLFIDELGELPLSIQAVLLRALDYREVKPVGADMPVPVDVRLVAATNRDLEEMVQRGKFREDLLHRVRVVRMRLPSLRERKEDLPLLMEHFQSMLGLRCTFEPAAWKRLLEHSWPGNIRALRNTIERVGNLRRQLPVREQDLDLPAAPRGAPAGMKQLENEAILAALERCGGNQVHAAKALGIGLSTLKRRMKDLRGADDPEA